MKLSPTLNGAKALELEALIKAVDGQMTETQEQYIRTAITTLKKGGSMKDAHDELGISAAAMNNAIRGIRKKAAKNGYDANRPHLDLAPAGFGLKRLTELKGSDGEIKQHYQIYMPEAQDIQDVMQDMLSSLRKDIPRIKAPRGKPLPGSSDLYNVAVFGDPHINMYAWNRETSMQDWDVDLAIEQHRNAMSDLLRRAPRAKRGCLATMGDLFHSDGKLPLTPKSGNVVDQDTRWSEAVDRTITMLRWMVDEYLEVVEHLDLVIVPGNHSLILERMVAKVLEVAFEKNNRVTVHDNTCPHIPIVWEKNFLLFTHGDGMNVQRKADVATSLFREKHGNAKFTHVLAGHLHHAEVKHVSGCRVEIFEVLPPPDAWHVDNGYVSSDQSASLMTYHKDGGIVTRNTHYPRIKLEEK